MARATTGPCKVYHAQWALEFSCLVQQLNDDKIKKIEEILIRLDLINVHNF